MPLSTKQQTGKMREKLIDSALGLFLQKGFHNTAVRDIIKEASVGTGTFYHYFSDREEILEVLLNRFAAEIIADISAYYLVEADLIDRFIETKRITMASFARNEAMSELYCRVPGTSPRIDACIKTFEDTLIRFYQRNLEFGVSKGSFRAVPAGPVAHSILATEKHLLFRWIVLHELTREEMVEMVVSFHETLAHGLMQPPKTEEDAEK